jgi:hypothetical protein
VNEYPCGPMTARPQTMGGPARIGERRLRWMARASVVAGVVATGGMVLNGGVASATVLASSASSPASPASPASSANGLASVPSPPVGGDSTTMTFGYGFHTGGDMAVDTAGDVFVADFARVLKITPEGSETIYRSA